MLADFLAYGLLFLTAFAAASVLPFYSEPMLVGMLWTGDYSSWALWLAASTGNTFGAVVNWWLARYALHWQDKRWFPLKQRELDIGTRWFNRYGVWTLLLAWAPLGGDALTFVAGLMRVRLDLFLVLVGLGKAARYAFVIWVTHASLA